MLNLLNPIWLSAIAALSIAVIIHLWNVRPGKVLKVGSIALMDAASRNSSRSFKLLDIVLLLVRCLLLCLLAVLLAGPSWIRPAKNTRAKGWILIPAMEAHEIFRHFNPVLNALLKQGYEPHWFAGKFDKIDTVLLAAYKNTAAPPPRIYIRENEVVNYWPLLKELNQVAPDSLPVYLFTSNRLEHFAGKRPDVNLNLHWQTYTPGDSINNWIEKAALTSQGDRIKITAGNSGPTGTTFIYNAVQSTEQRNSVYQVNFNNGQPAVNFKNDPSAKAIAVDTAALRIAIYSDKNSGDARYLEAALNSIKQFTDRKMEIRLSDHDKSIPGTPDWIFWLSERKIPEAYITGKSNVFEYETGKAENIRSEINFPGEVKVPLYKHIAGAPNTITPLWRDGFGSVVLGEEEGTRTSVYHFYSRLNPGWNDLVWSDKFPKVMLDLIMNQSVESFSKSVKFTNDRRIIADAQLLPDMTGSDEHHIQTKPNDVTDLSKAVWLVLALIFLIERWLAHKTKPVENYG
ncbi:BatA domain-containing protein [Mucilaginibacter sp. AW1-3]